LLVRNSIHGIDLVRYILGDPVRVHSLTWPNEKFKNAAASFTSVLEYERGVVASITDLWDTPQVWRLKVVAEAGWIEFEPLEIGWFVNEKGQKTRLKSDPIDTDFRMGVYAQDLGFIEAVRQAQKPGRPACLLPDSLKTMILIEQIAAGRLNRGQPGDKVAPLD
jgi:predicted dehydrogenase